MNDTENNIHELNLQTQNKTTEIKAIKMFVKKQFYLIKKYLTKIDSQPELSKEFIELLQRQNKNLVEENKSKTTIIEKFETVTWKSNRKQIIHKTDEIKCSNRYETLYIDDIDDVSCN